MMNIKNYLENRRKKIITIFILIDLKREIKKNIVIVMKAKTNIYRSNTLDETILIIIQTCNMFQKQNKTMFSNLLNAKFK